MFRAPVNVDKAIRVVEGNADAIFTKKFDWNNNLIVCIVNRHTA
jgi:hypothetical protein